MGTPDTDLRTPDGKRPPHVSNRPPLQKKKRTKKPRRGQRVPIAARSGAKPRVLGLARPCSTRAARHRRLPPRRAGSGAIMQACREVFGRPGRRRS